MLIRGKTVYVYDIEIFPNVFHCKVKNSETKERLLFEISERRNDLTKLVDFFWTIRDQSQKEIWEKNYTTDLQFNTDKIFCG